MSTTAVMAPDAEEPRAKKDDEPKGIDFVVTTRYSLRYTTKDSVPIPDIIESLRSMERLIKRTPTFVEHRFDEVKVSETQVFVERLESGSLDLDFVIKFFCRTEERTERAKQLIKEMTEEKGVVRDLVAIGIGGMLVIGAYQILSPGNAAPSSTITAYQSVVIQAGQNVGLTEQQFKDAVKKIPDQKTLGKDAFKVLKPATQDKQAVLSVPDMPELSIERDVIGSLPESYEAPQPTERTESYDDVKLSIDASDRHNNDKGWAGSVHNLVDSRVKFVLDESIDPATLHGKTTVKANVTIVSRYIPSKKKYEIKEVQIDDILAP